MVGGAFLADGFGCAYSTPSKGHPVEKCMYISVVFFLYSVFERQSGLPVATNSETYAAKAQYQSVVLTSGLVTFIAAYLYRIFNSLVCL